VQVTIDPELFKQKGRGQLKMTRVFLKTEHNKPSKAVRDSEQFGHEGKGAVTFTFDKNLEPGLYVANLHYADVPEKTAPLAVHGHVFNVDTLKEGALARKLPSALAGTALVVTAFLALYYLGVSPYVSSRKALVVPPFCARVREVAGRERLVLYRVPPSVAFHLERSQAIRFDVGDALADLEGARGVVTDETGARALLERRPELSRAFESAPWFKATEQGDVWRLVFLENGAPSR